MKLGMTVQSTRGRIAAVSLLLPILFSVGCVSNLQYQQTARQPVPPPQKIIQLPAFPPQTVMERGNYCGFLMENEQALKECNSAEECEVALFNLGFVHAYSKSPYFDRIKAIGYFRRLAKDYPNSSLTYESAVWSEMLQKEALLERKQIRLQNELSTKDATIDELRDQIKRTSEIDDELRNQLKRSREIDAEIDRKEKELSQ